MSWLVDAYRPRAPRKGTRLSPELVEEVIRLGEQIVALDSNATVPAFLNRLDKNNPGFKKDFPLLSTFYTERCQGGEVMNLGILCYQGVLREVTYSLEKPRSLKTWLERVKEAVKKTA